MAAVDGDDTEVTKAKIRELWEDIASRRRELDKVATEEEKVEEEKRHERQQIDNLKAELDMLRRAKSERDNAENQKEVEDMERNKLREDTVRHLLRRYIPRLASVDEDRHSSKDEDSKSDGKEAPVETTTKDKDTHKHVLVSYSNVGNGPDDYQVGYRIDKTITVGQLHRDVCAYWGCTHTDYVLCNLEGKEKAEPLWLRDDPEKHTKLSRSLQQDVLLSGERAQLHLVRFSQLQDFEEAARKLKEKNITPQDLQVQSKANDPATIKTLKHGFVSTETVAEPWVEAMKIWPGMYRLLKTRDRVRGRKWARSRLADFIIVGILIVLCFAITTLHDAGPDRYLLRQGVVEALGRGVKGETSGPPVVGFQNLKIAPDVWAWLMGPLHYQIWNKNSTLRRYYTPLGMLRMRQQRAGAAPCKSRELPLYLKKTCYHLKVDTVTMGKGSLIPQFAEELKRYNNMTADASWHKDPNPFEWQPGKPPHSILPGVMQTYGGDGYSALFNMSKPISPEAWMKDLTFLSQTWLSAQARLVVIEVTLANRHFGGFVSANFMVELSASGAIQTTMDVTSFNVHESDEVKTINALDWTRCIITFLWLGFIRLYMKTYERMQQGRNSFSYIVSFSGVIDTVTVGMTAATRYIRHKGPFPDPTTVQGFHNYSYLGSANDMSGVIEACLLLVLIVRFTTLLRFSPTTFRLFKLFTRSIRMFVSFAFIFVPLLVGAAFLAHAIWSPYIRNYSDWRTSLSEVMLGTYQPFPDLVRMADTGGSWAIPFIVYFFLSTKVFAVHMFLAITVQAFFEVELLEGADAAKESWSMDQYLDWALWPAVYEKVFDKKPGASRQDGYADAQDASDSGSSSGSDEDK